MAVDAKKRGLYISILNEIQKFDNPEEEQKLALITKRLAMTKQNLNYYLRRFLDSGLICKLQDQPFAIYKITEKGRRVKENLVQSERGVKIAMWRYHNLIVGYKVFTWGSWRFNDRKKIRMNNWTYQIAEAKNGLQAHIQDTGLLKIYGPKMVGPDAEEMRIRASAQVQDAAQWFADHYDLKLAEPKILRKGQKELLNSEQLAKLVGRVKTGDYWIDASGGDENLEEYEDSYKVENILSNLEETPLRLNTIENNQNGIRKDLNELRPVLQELTRQLALHLSVEQKTEGHMAASEETMKNINAGISELRDTLRYQVQTPSGHGDRPHTDLSEPQIIDKPHKMGLERHLEPQTVEIEILGETPRFKYEWRGADRIIGPFYQGARIYLPGDVARQLVRDGHARILGDKA